MYLFIAGLNPLSRAPPRLLVSAINSIRAEGGRGCCTSSRAQVERGIFERKPRSLYVINKRLERKNNKVIPSAADVQQFLEVNASESRTVVLASKPDTTAAPSPIAKAPSPSKPTSDKEG